MKKMKRLLCATALILSAVQAADSSAQSLPSVVSMSTTLGESLPAGGAEIFLYTLDEESFRLLCNACGDGLVAPANAACVTSTSIAEAFGSIVGRELTSQIECIRLFNTPSNTWEQSIDYDYGSQTVVCSCNHV